MFDRTVLSAGLAQARCWPLALALLGAGALADVTPGRHFGALVEAGGTPSGGELHWRASASFSNANAQALANGGSDGVRLHAAASAYASAAERSPPAPVPEPASMALALAGLACIRVGAWLKARSGRVGRRRVSRRASS
jgi:hypothetical protein